MGRAQMAGGPGERITDELYVPVTPAQEACIEVLNSQTRITSAPYYSTIHIQAEAVGDQGGPYTYTINAGTEFRAFSYGVRTTGESAGFPQAWGQMTYAETNIQEKARTNSGQSVVIYGIAAMPEPGGVYKVEGTDTETWGKRFLDARLLAQVARNCSISLRLNGDENVLRMGKLGAIPAHGGLAGAGFDSLGTQDIAGGRLPFDFATNGRPGVTDFMRIPEGFVWKNTGNPDSQLEILVKAERAIRLYSGGDELNPAADETGAAGIRGYTYPDVIMCDITFYVLGWVMARRTNLM